jgi:hypothetical protein
MIPMAARMTPNATPPIVPPTMAPIFGPWWWVTGVAVADALANV